jgi:hypothetical protein
VLSRFHYLHCAFLDGDRDRRQPFGLAVPRLLCYPPVTAEGTRVMRQTAVTVALVGLVMLGMGAQQARGIS